MKNWIYKDFLIHEFSELSSTNSHAFELAKSGSCDREIIFSLSQSAGRGRQNRLWQSPKGNLYFSLILKPKTLAKKISQLSFLAIVALRLTVEKIFAENSKIKAGYKVPEIKNKWPNDLLIGNKKCAGLLLESSLNNSQVDFVVIGIGLNLVSNPDDVIFPATNLQNFDIEVFPKTMLIKFLDEFEKLYRNWLDFGFAGTRRLWLEQAFCLKEKIIVKLDEKQIEGIFEDLDEEGNLLVSCKGEFLKISAADIFVDQRSDPQKP